VNLLFKGREWYREFHEQDHEHSVETQDDEREYSGDCRNCKWDYHCEGGCRVNPKSVYKFEKKEGEEE